MKSYQRVMCKNDRYREALLIVVDKDLEEFKSTLACGICLGQNGRTRFH